MVGMAACSAIQVRCQFTIVLLVHGIHALVQWRVGFVQRRHGRRRRTQCRHFLQHGQKGQWIAARARQINAGGVIGAELGTTVETSEHDCCTVLFDVTTRKAACDTAAGMNLTGGDGTGRAQLLLLANDLVVVALHHPLAQRRH